MTWNSRRYRYFDNIWMAQILRGIVALKRTPRKGTCGGILKLLRDISKRGDLPEPTALTGMTAASCHLTLHEDRDPLRVNILAS